MQHLKKTIQPLQLYFFGYFQIISGGPGFLLNSAGQPGLPRHRHCLSVPDRQGR
jgi:hypothetical protein